MSARSDLERQILDEGRTSWTEQDDAGGSAALFETLILEPLRELQAAGLFEELREHVGSYRTGRRVDKVIIGLLNEDYDIRTEDDPIDELDSQISELIAGAMSNKQATAETFLSIKPGTIEPDKLAELRKRKQALDAELERSISMLKQWQAARQPYDQDGEWKGQGTIAKAREWIALLNAWRAAKDNPELFAAAGNDARQFFHKLNELRDRAQRNAPHKSARFIEKAAILADEARELFD